MTEISRPWGGTATGDKGPYTDDNWTDVWSGLFARTSVNVGVLRGAANELVVTSSGDNAISVNTGEALVNGTWYQSDAATAITPSAPSANPRIDRIVLRKSWSAQTVRVTRIAGAEAGSPSAPALVQTDGTTWDIPLAQYQIATGAGAISSLTDQREFVHDPTGAVDVADGGTGASSFTDGGILLGSGTAAITAMAALGNGVIVVGDGTTDPTTITALTGSTGTLKHEVGGIEADISAIADGGIVVGTGTGAMAIRASVLTGGASGFLKHEVGGLEFNASAVTTGDIIAGASAGTLAIVAASGASAGDVLTIQSDGTTDYETITGVGAVTSGTLSTGAVLADVTMTLGSDADGDIYYRASNKLTRLAKGAAAEVLKMNSGATAPEWGAGGGKILQVVSDNADTQYSTDSATLQLVADPAVTITPANSSNKILIIGGIVGYNPADQTIIDLQRAISGGATTSGLSGQTHGMGFMEGGNNTMRQTLTYLDSPSTTSAVTYKFMFSNENGSQLIYIGNNTSQANLIAIEVDGT
jgi:hypothetical protein